MTCVFQTLVDVTHQRANILAPAAFTYTTGKLHWQLLLQARAMDSQCFVLGAAQQGWHGEQRQTWGMQGLQDSRGQLYRDDKHGGHGLVPMLLTLMNKIPFAFPCHLCSIAD